MLPNMGISGGLNYAENSQINNVEKHNVTLNFMAYVCVCFPVFNRRFIRDRARRNQMEGIITFRDILLLKRIMRGTIRVD